MSQEQILSKRHRKPQEPNENNNSIKKLKAETQSNCSDEWLLEKEQKIVRKLLTLNDEKHIHSIALLRANFIKLTARTLAISYKQNAIKFCQFILVKIISRNDTRIILYNLSQLISPNTNLEEIPEKIFEDEIIYILQYIKSNNSNFDTNIAELMSLSEIGAIFTFFLYPIPYHYYWGNHKKNPVFMNGTLLHFAATKGMPKVTQWLLENGADTMICDSEDNLPIHKSFKSGNSKTIHLLLDHDLKRNTWKGSKFSDKTDFCNNIWNTICDRYTTLLNKKIIISLFKKLIIEGAQFGADNPAIERDKDWLYAWRGYEHSYAFLIPAIQKVLISLFTQKSYSKNSLWNIYHLTELGKNKKRGQPNYLTIKKLIANIWPICDEEEKRVLIEKLPLELQELVHVVDNDMKIIYQQKMNDKLRAKGLTYYLNLKTYSKLLTHTPGADTFCPLEYLYNLDQGDNSYTVQFLKNSGSSDPDDSFSESGESDSESYSSYSESYSSYSDSDLEITTDSTNSNLGMAKYSYNFFVSPEKNYDTNKRAFYTLKFFESLDLIEPPASQAPTDFNNLDLEAPERSFNSNNS